MIFADFIGKKETAYPISKISVPIARGSNKSDNAIPNNNVTEKSHFTAVRIVQKAKVSTVSFPMIT